MHEKRWPPVRESTILILTLDEAKTQLRLERDFTAHDEMLNRLIKAAQRNIERTYYCRLVEDQGQLDALADGETGYIIDEDIKLAVALMVSQWYLNPTGTGEASPSDLGVEYLLFPLMEHTV